MAKLYAITKIPKCHKQTLDISCEDPASRSCRLINYSTSLPERRQETDRSWERHQLRVPRNFGNCSAGLIWTITADYIILVHATTFVAARNSELNRKLLELDCKQLLQYIKKAKLLKETREVARLHKECSVLDKSQIY